MKIASLDEIIAGHRLFAGLQPAFLRLVTGCARNAHFDAGTYLFREGDSADTIYLIRHGRVGLEVAAPGLGRMAIQTIGPDDFVGLSWLVPPYRWRYDARVVEETRAISIDAACLRGKCDADPALGYEMMKRFMPIVVERLHETRLQILDVYGRRA